MKKIYVLFILVLATTFSGCDEPEGSPDGVAYEVRLSDASKDRFIVKVFLPVLTASDDIFQFAATAPGIYSIADIGRFIEDFKVFDAQGNQLEAKNISTNQWQITDPENASYIEYTARDTWDTPVNENPIYEMSGTSLEGDHVLFNPYCVIGYPENYKEQKMFVKLFIPSSWKIGTALSKNAQGYYEAEDFDELVDSPFLMGQLTTSSQTTSNAKINIYCYTTPNVDVTANDLATNISDVIDATEDFLKGIPVDRYTFLFHFGEKNAGAWEHNYSSEYVLANYNGQGVKWIAAHEFFHIVTPLNIHSEIIENFNFVTPIPSQHLWLYEGVTEWAANTLLYRGGKSTEMQYFDALSSKIYSDRKFFDASFSLTEISLQSYEPQGQMQYANIYRRGAIVATLLDIRLLELSNGQKGLRDVILQLIDMYGKETPFDDDTFFQTLVAITYPEIESFINNYIKDSQPLPYQEFFAKIGVQYIDNGDLRPGLTKMTNPTAQQTALFQAWSTNR